MLSRMNKRPKKKKDISELAFSIVQKATDENPDDEQPTEKNPAAVALGRLGGLKGGPARARKLTKEQRSEIAKKAARSRWKNTRHKK